MIKRVYLWSPQGSRQSEEEEQGRLPNLVSLLEVAVLETMALEEQNYLKDPVGRPVVTPLETAVAKQRRPEESEEPEEPGGAEECVDDQPDASKRDRGGQGRPRLPRLHTKGF